MTHASPQPADAVAGLDQLLSDAAVGPLRRMVPPAGVLARCAASLARRPGAVTAHGRTFAGELARIGSGRSELAPAPGDKRFRDPAWTGNPLLRLALQLHLATSRVANDVLAEADLDWKDTDRLSLTVSNLLDAFAPSNNPVLNPLAWKALVDTGGLSAVRGLRRLVTDLSTAPRVPAMVDADAFTVGVDLAVSPGWVVHRTALFELIQYSPTTPTVREIPLLIIPPTINKYYVADLAPGRSIVEGLVADGQQVFMMSWRNPGSEHASWDLDTYGGAVIDALDAVARVSGAARAALMAFCSGGIITAGVLAHLTAIGDGDRIAAVAFAVTVLDQERPGVVGALLDRQGAKDAVRASAKKGYLDGAMLAEVFAWLRPNDLIWNYWVNNYLQGKAPAAFDILFWNADTTRMPAALHRDFLAISTENSLTKPGALSMRGTPVDLATVRADSYVIAGIADHLCRWQSCYATTQLLGGESRFVLSTSGHIASLVNPPGNPKANFRAAAATQPDGERWLAETPTTKGSWWPDFSSWLAERCGESIDAPPELDANTRTMSPAPGTYVFAK